MQYSVLILDVTFFTLNIFPIKRIEKPWLCCMPYKKCYFVILVLYLEYIATIPAIPANIVGKINTMNIL